jgi:hypothetical protein
MAVCYSQNQLWIQARNRIVTPEKDQDGMAAYVEKHKDIWLDIIKNLNLDTEDHTIVIDCEWAGDNINRGNAACSGQDKSAYIFKNFRYVDNRDEKITYISTSKIKSIPNKNIYALANFGEYYMPLDFNQLENYVDFLNNVTAFIEDNSPIATFFGQSDNVGEGLVYTAMYKGQFVAFKTKGTKHGGKLKKKHNKSKITDETKAVYQDIADKITPEWRLTQGITETKASSIEDTGKLIKWVIADIIKEESHILQENKVTMKDINRYVSKIVVSFFKDYLEQNI